MHATLLHAWGRGALDLDVVAEAAEAAAKVASSIATEATVWVLGFTEAACIEEARLFGAGTRRESHATITACG